MKSHLKIITTLLFMVFSETIFAQKEINSENNFNLYNTQVKLIKSQFVDDTFHIFISLPDDYASTNKSFPVLYVLDGDISYGMAVSIARYLEIGGNIPELIVVAIGYGAIDKSSGNKRNRDYRPAATGGAENFLLFIKEELIPHIDNNYRTSKENRTISGYSSGGLFVLYVLFTQPALFKNYIAGSPYLLPDSYIIFDYEEEAITLLIDVDAKLFISVGSEESDEKYFNPIDELVTIIQSREYSGLKLETKVFDGSTHLVGPPEVITHGLISVFKE